MNIVPKNIEKNNNLSKQQCKSQINTKIAKMHFPEKKTMNCRY